MPGKISFFSSTFLVSLALAVATPAYAGSFTISTGTNTTAQTLGSGSGQTGTVAAGAALSVGNTSTVVNMTGASSLLTNSGLVQQTGSVAGTGNTVTMAGAGSTVTNNVGGTITNASSAPDPKNTGVTILVSGSNETINNLGTMSATGNGRVIRDNTGVAGLVINNGSISNSTALMQAADADVIQVNKDKATASVVLNNYGIMNSLNASGGGAQVADFNAVLTGANTINNYATGVMNASEADVIRPGVNGVVYNAGIMKSTTTTGSSSDGVDAQNNSGVIITNDKVSGSTLGTGLIEGARHGITGGAATNAVNFTMNVTNNAGATIQGDNGSGINIDGFNGKEVVTVNNAGTITGKGVTGDGDGVDVDGAVNLVNTGVIQSLNAVPEAGETVAFSEGLSVGGGTITNSGTIKGLVDGANAAGLGRGITLVGNDIAGSPGQRDGVYADSVVTNQSGGLIYGQNDAGVFVGGNASGHTITINNNAGATIQTGSTTGAAIQTGVDGVTINNAGTIDGSKSGMAIALGSGSDTVNLSTGSNIKGSMDGGAGNDTLHLSGTGTIGSTSNFEALNVDGGKWTLTGSQSYGNGSVTNGGILALDPTTATFIDLTIDATGALQGGIGDVFSVSGDFINNSTQNTLWDTGGATLEFSGGLHDVDFGSDPTAGFTNNFAWGSVEVDANGSLHFLDPGAVVYTDLFILKGGIDQLKSFTGDFTIYYDAGETENAYLNGQNYDIGGAHLHATPAPGGLILLAAGLAGLGVLRRQSKSA